MKIIKKLFYLLLMLLLVWVLISYFDIILHNWNSYVYANWNLIYLIFGK